MGKVAPFLPFTSHHSNRAFMCMQNRLMNVALDGVMALAEGCNEVKYAKLDVHRLLAGSVSRAFDS